MYLGWAPEDGAREMLREDDSGPASLGWTRRLGVVGGTYPAVLLSRLPSLPDAARAGLRRSESPFALPGVTEGETLTSGSPKAASVSSAAIPSSPAEFFPPAPRPCRRLPGEEG